MLLLNMNSFIDKWYIEPIKMHAGYNPINTLTYALIFVGIVWILYKYLFHKIKIDAFFVIAAAGWILYGSSLRVLNDLSIYTSLLYVTPFVYFFTSIFAIAVLFFSLKLQKMKKINYYFSWGLVGYLFAIYNLTKIPLNNLIGFALVLFLSLLWIVFFFGSRRFVPKFLNKWNIFALSAQMFDASATFVSINYYNFVEQHVVPTFFISNFGAWSFLILKLAVVFLVLYLINGSSNEKEKRYLAFVVAFLGLATGFRDILLLLATS